MSDVFISYARPDRKTVEQLAECLEREGYSVWWDYSLHPGDSFRAVIEKQLQTAKAAIVLWSRHSIGSAFVVDEAARAHRRKVLVPVLIGGLEAEMLPLGFGGIHVEDLSDWRGETTHASYRRVVEGLIHKAGPGSSRGEPPSAATATDAEAVPRHSATRGESEAGAGSGRISTGAISEAEYSRGKSDAWYDAAEWKRIGARLDIAYGAAFVTGLALILWLFLEAKQDWNLWLGISAPLIAWSVLGFVFARRSLRAAMLLAIVHSILGLIIFLIAPG